MRIQHWIIAGLLSTTIPALATTPHFGGSLSFPLVSKDPQNIHGYRAAIWYQPDSFIWGCLHLYFDASFGHWWVNNVPNKSLSTYAIAPVLRYYFKQTPYISPYISASIGPAYLTKTKIYHQNLGIHLAFQDQLGIGAAFGANQQFSVSISAMHYSNGSLSKHNAGITIPVMINAEYGFA